MTGDSRRARAAGRASCSRRGWADWPRQATSSRRHRVDRGASWGDCRGQAAAGCRRRRRCQVARDAARALADWQTRHPGDWRHRHRGCRPGDSVHQYHPAAAPDGSCRPCPRHHPAASCQARVAGRKGRDASAAWAAPRRSAATAATCCRHPWRAAGMTAAAPSPADGRASAAAASSAGVASASAAAARAGPRAPPAVPSVRRAEPWAPPDGPPAGTCRLDHHRPRPARAARLRQRHPPRRTPPCTPTRAYDAFDFAFRKTPTTSPEPASRSGCLRIHRSQQPFHLPLQQSLRQKPKQPQPADHPRRVTSPPASRLPPPAGADAGRSAFRSPAPRRLPRSGPNCGRGSDPGP